jgi:hypothetical protein
MRRSPKEVEKYITDAANAWTTLRPSKTFSDLTLEQFKEAVKPSQDARAEILDLEGRMQAAFARRDEADTESAVLVRRIVNALKGDPEEGEDGELYAAMGYVRRSVRNSGLTRRRGTDSTKKPSEAA